MKTSYQSPVYKIRRVPLDQIRSNAYNPNSVAPPEMKLLYQSIKEDGYTMPIVCYKLEDGTYEIVDGFTALGQVKISFPLSFFRKGVYFAALFILPACFGARAAFYAEPVSDIVGPLVSAIVYKLCIGHVLSDEHARI